MGSLEHLKLKKLVQEAQPEPSEVKPDGSVNEFIFTFKNDQEAENSNPSEKFSYLGHVAPVLSSDPSSYQIPWNVPLGTIEEDAQDMYGSISNQNVILKSNASFKKISEGGLTYR